MCVCVYVYAGGGYTTSPLHSINSCDQQMKNYLRRIEKIMSVERSHPIPPLGKNPVGAKFYLSENVKQIKVSVSKMLQPLGNTK